MKKYQGYGVACYIDNITNYQLSQPGSFFAWILAGDLKESLKAGTA